MQTYLFSSHGGHIPHAKKGAQVLTLPDNVIMVMNCNNKLMMSTNELDAAVWSFVSNTKLHLAVARNRFRLPYFVNYLTELMNLPQYRTQTNAYGKEEGHENLLCIFTHKCPNMILKVEEDGFRSGLVKAPIKITWKNTNTGQTKALTPDMFTAYSQKQPQTSQDAHIITRWLYPTYKKSNDKFEKFAVKPTMIAFDTTQPLELHQLIKEISSKNPDTMNVIIVYACRDGVPTTMKLRQYEVTGQPLSTALAFYEKFMKFKIAKGI